MDQLIKDFEKFAKKQAASEPSLLRTLDLLIKHISDAKERIGTDPSIAAATLGALAKTVKTSAATHSEEQREVYNVLTKYGKAIDKKFKPDLSLASNAEAFAGKENILRKTVALHFVRQGQFNLAAMFAEDANLSIPKELNAQFMEMYEILEALKVRNLEPAIRWARGKRDDLERKGSALEFTLHKLQLIKLMTTGERCPALEYAKRTMGHFAHRHMTEIQRLMCAFVYINRLERSPYSELLSTSYWSDVQNLFTRDFCSLLGFSCDSPLYISVTVGSSAIPTIIKMSTIMAAKKTEWSAQNELPVEIPLPDDVRFHSIFACPVSKEQATEENPPMMLPCGHVICKESLTRLSKGNSARFKCPYCPTESNASQAQRIYL